MGMGMEMRAVEDIEMGEEVTEAVRPLCFELAEDDNPISLVSRAALRLLRFPSSGHRIAGILTNRTNLISDPDAASAVTETAAAAEIGEHEAAAAVCAVLTNAVEACGGIAVYGPAFSWINHSCSPNAAYFISDDDGQRLSASRLAAYDGDRRISLPEECGWCEGPRVRVRSVKRIRAGEAVTITYTELLQPKGLRQSELWSKYRFICSCPRCTADPLTYVDCVLEEISSTVSVMEAFEDAVADYLSLGDPESCCDKLHRLLACLNPLHHLSIKAYSVLGSAYKARDMRRASCAYSLLLAGATDHLFRHEPSLIVSAAHYWINGGESLVTFSRSNASDRFPNCLPLCDRCSDFDEASREIRKRGADLAGRVWGFLAQGSCHLREFENPFEFGRVENSPSLRDGSESDEMMDAFQLGVHCLVYGRYLATICFGEQSYLHCQVQALFNRKDT